MENKEKGAWGGAIAGLIAGAEQKHCKRQRNRKNKSKYLFHLILKFLSK